ncbi:MAG: hypothetical protein KDC35_11880 [Acidobacteria bacterium]|nr:hypothetical protein [Acidobacteriota bacterium]
MDRRFKGSRTALIDQILSEYLLPDGVIKSFAIHYEEYSEQVNRPTTAELCLQVRKKSNKETCTIRLRFEGVREVSLFEDFGCKSYSDFVLVAQNGGVYSAVDPQRQLRQTPPQRQLCDSRSSGDL